MQGALGPVRQNASGRWILTDAGIEAYLALDHETFGAEAGSGSDGRAGGRDWVDASVPYLWRFQQPNYWGFVKCAARVPSAWVSRRPSRGWIRCQLTDRGRDILERRLKSHILGVGPYRGMRLLPTRHE
jgi:hypothetical protein